MPHDKNGKLVELGDVVQVTGKVIGVTPSNEYCNLTVELQPMPPYTTPYNLSINANQTEIISKA